MSLQNLAYWYALAFMPGTGKGRSNSLTTERRNNIYIAAFQHEPRLSIVELFERKELWPKLGLTAEECQAFTQDYSELANYSFQIEQWLNQGYELIPFHDERYPKSLKTNLKRRTPTMLFAKGNVELLHQPMTAIVGSRDASEISLQFTDHIAPKAAQSGQVVVSGGAKGVDQRALEAVLACGGSSVVVLAQGIDTFQAGFKQYYQAIVAGKLLVISSYAPTDRWSTWRAMARNKLVYGLATHTYVAQSGASGGTWEGVKEGLRAQRSIFVRQPEANELCANNQLIAQGAQPVDLYGNEIELPILS